MSGEIKQRCPVDASHWFVAPGLQVSIEGWKSSEREGIRMGDCPTQCVVFKLNVSAQLPNVFFSVANNGTEPLRRLGRDQLN